MTEEQSKQRDSQDDQFHKMVGFCITEWAHVDELIFDIFHQCVGPLKQCAIIYYRTPGLEMRLGLTDEIVKAVLPKPARKSGTIRLTNHGARDRQALA